MSGFFSKKKTIQELERENAKVLKKASREIDRERLELDKREAKLILDIKSVARKNDKAMMKSNVAMAGVMANTSEVMKSMTKTMDPIKTSETMRNFQRESDRFAMTEEMMNDTMDDIMNGSDDEEECDLIVSQVLDEIGINTKSLMSKAPSAHNASLRKEEAESLANLERQIQQLKE